VLLGDVYDVGIWVEYEGIDEGSKQFVVCGCWISGNNKGQNKELGGVYKISGCCISVQYMASELNTILVLEPRSNSTISSV
jgi:hypothetical protein